LKTHTSKWAITTNTIVSLNILSFQELILITILRSLNVHIIFIALFKGLYASLNSQTIGGKPYRVVMDRFGIFTTPLVYLVIAVLFTIAAIVGFDLKSYITFSVFVCLSAVGFYGFRASRERLIDKSVEKNTEQIRADIKQLDRAMSLISSLLVSLSAMVFSIPPVLVYGAFAPLVIGLIIYAIWSNRRTSRNELMANALQT
jgi:hypothetical protein